MPRIPRAAGLPKLSGLVLLVCALLAAVEVTGLIGSVVTATATMRTTTAVPCATDDRGPLWPVLVRDGVTRHLVPAGAASLAVCGYNGNYATRSAPEFGLIRAGESFDQRVIDRIAAQLDALKPAPGSHSCLLEQGRDDVLTFEYPTGPPVVLTLDTGGCGTVNNGHIQRLTLGGPVAQEVWALSSRPLGLEWPYVAGDVRLCGGPYPSHCRVQNFDKADQVVATNADGLWVAMAPVSRGRFHFRIASPGTYTFGLYAGKQLVKKLRRQVVSGKTTQIVFPVPVP